MWPPIDRSWRREIKAHGFCIMRAGASRRIEHVLASFVRPERSRERGWAATPQAAEERKLQAYARELLEGRTIAFLVAAATSLIDHSDSASPSPAVPLAGVCAQRLHRLTKLT